MIRPQLNLATGLQVEGNNLRFWLRCDRLFMVVYASACFRMVL